MMQPAKLVNADDHDGDRAQLLRQVGTGTVNPLEVDRACHAMPGLREFLGKVEDLNRSNPPLPSRAEIEDAVAAGTPLMIGAVGVRFAITEAGKDVLAHRGNDTTVCPWCEKPISEDDLVAPIGGRLVHDDGGLDDAKGCRAQFEAEVAAG